MSDVPSEVKEEGTTEEIVVSTELKNIIEALIFACDEPMTVRFIRSIVDEVNKDILPAEQYQVNAEIIRKAVGELNRGYGRLGSGFRIIEIAGGFTYATQEQFSSWVGKLAKEKARRRLSPTAVETLAIIAYKQPIAKGEVEFIRGVNVDYIINALLEKDLIHITGRANSPGRPLLYGTTQKFLEHFGLNELSDLPKPREISELINETELEVDRRLLAEQQELEFKEDLEKKLDGNEGSKNKPQRAAKVKVPEDVKAENRRTAQQGGTTDQTPVPVENKNVEEGVPSSESNLATDEMTGAAAVEQTIAAENPAIDPESLAGSGQEHLAADVPAGRMESPEEQPAVLEASSVKIPEATIVTDVPEIPSAENELEHSATAEPVNLAPEAPADLPIAKEEQIVTVPEDREQVPAESIPNRSKDVAAVHSEVLENAHPDQAGFPVENQDAFQESQQGQTGWSKWKNKVKTFFQKLFA
ncbi:MAG: SMC-Scp complex subunit ScpB [Bacteroidota bacterium]